MNWGEGEKAGKVLHGGKTKETFHFLESSPPPAVDPHPTPVSHVHMGHNPIACCLTSPRLY